MLWSLILTCAVETSLLVLIFRRNKKLQLRQIILYGLLINCLTQPLLNLAYNLLGINLLLLEAIVFLIEAVLIRALFDVKWSRAMLISTAVNLVTLLLGLVINPIVVNRSDQLQELIMLSCPGVQLQVQCISDLGVKLTTDDPKVADEFQQSLLKLVAQGKVSNDAREFSDLVHDLGMQIASSNLPLSDKLKACGSTFKYACFHGILMQEMESMSVGDLVDFCAGSLFTSLPAWRANCLHAFGHTLATREPGGLVAAAKSCNYDNASDLMACVSGVLMEYSRGGLGKSEHSHEPVYTVPLDCSDFSDYDYQRVCFASVGSYRQYAANFEDFTTTAEICNAAGEFAQVCQQASWERLFLARGYSQSKSIEKCAELPSELNDACQNFIDTLNQGVSAALL